MIQLYPFLTVTRQEGKKKAMCVVNIRVHCSDAFSELLLEDKEQAELFIESIVSTALLEAFDAVHVENVAVHHLSNDLDRHASTSWNERES